MTSRRVAGLLLVAAALLLGACTTVPGTSSPDVVRTVDNGPLIDSPRSCAPDGSLARTVVTSFLQLNGGANFDAARVCLTPNARAQWAPNSTVTIVDNQTIGNLHQSKVRVIGRQIGQLINGAYKPTLTGDGTGDSAQLTPVSFRMVKLRGQWRINSVQPNGRLVTTDQFEDFQQRYLYFYDVAETKLVPVPLYTQITDPQDLTRWLISNLAAGPGSNALASALPGQPEASQIRVFFPPGGDTGLSVRVDIPGVSRLSGATLGRLAAQLAKTLEQAGVGRIAITDQGAPVHIGLGMSFTPNAVLRGGNSPYEARTTNGSGSLFYVDNGALQETVGATSRPVPGPVGQGVYALTSAAVTLPDGSPTLRIAGVRGIGAKKYLVVGGQQGPLEPTKPRLSGDLSRPAWAPGSGEIWIGDGHKLDRVLARSRDVQAIPIEPALTSKSYITAVRISPEGARIAMVVSETPASDPTIKSPSQIWVGTIVRTGGGVRVAGLTQISPPGVHVNDVAWYDAGKLFAIGSYIATGNFATFEVQVDGSQWTFHLPLNLPGRPTSLTAASNSVAVVGVAGSLWRQDGASWVALFGGEGGFAPGTNPVYIE